MGQFRKKPIVINAIQNDGNWQTIIDWLDFLNQVPVEIPFGHRPRITRNKDGSLNIVTIEGSNTTCSVGDWVICGVKGEFYPCEAEIFEMTYEPA